MRGNNSNTLYTCKVELKNIEDWINNHKLDSNVRYLVGYAVIKATGTIEQVVKTMLYEHLVGRSTKNEDLKAFLERRTIGASFNPNTDRIHKLICEMDKGYGKNFRDRINSSSQKMNLNSLVGLRNSFAHGSTITASIGDIVLYYDSGVWIVEQLFDVLKTTKS